MAESIIKHASKTSLVLMAFAVVFTAAMAFVFQITEAPIAKSEAEARLKLFGQIVPKTLYNNDVLNETISVAPNLLLGNTETTTINIGKLDNKPTVVILESIAHDGYSGDIKLLIALDVDATILGVRVITHAETPGLGDYIDIARSQWIKLFDGESLNKTAFAGWKVKKDGGNFDYMTGATITPRAVIKAVAKTLQFYNAEKDTLISPSNLGEQ